VPVGVEGWCVEGGPQGSSRGENADEDTVGIDYRCQPSVRAVQAFVSVLARDAVGEGEQVGRHHLVHLGEAVDVGAVPRRDDPDRTGTAPIVTIDDDGRSVRTLVDQRERIAGGRVPLEGDRGVVDGVPGLDPADDLADDVERDVLRDDRDPAATGDGLGHPASRDRGHVRDHERDGAAGSVGRGEIDVEPRRDGRPGGRHEDVVVGEVVTGPVAVEESHPLSLKPPLDTARG